MTKKLLFVVAILCALTFAVMAADVSGKWTYETQGRGGNTMTTTLTLKADGASLTGSMDSGRGNPVDISDGKVDGNTITFSVTRTMGQSGQSYTTKYTGTLDGDSLKIEWEQPARGGGEAQKREVTAKRSTT
jgi:hypothetical protein